MRRTWPDGIRHDHQQAREAGRAGPRREHRRAVHPGPPPDDPGDRYFEDDCCANCLQQLPDDEEGLFCSELCSQTASTIRYWRRIVRDGRIEQPDVRLAIRTRVAHLLAGGYQEAARRLSPTSRVQVWERDGGRCVLCGQPGAEIDHITDDSRELGNLQLLYAACHRAKTPPA